MDVSMSVVDYLNASGVGATVYHAVPSDREKLLPFAVVELTGGSASNPVQRRDSVDVDCWAKTRAEAAALASSVRSALFGMPDATDNAFHIEITSTYNNPDLDSGAPRYTVGADIYSCE